MKNYLILLCMSLSLFGYSQERFLTRTGQVNFEASVPSFEPVVAKNNSVTAILNPETGEIAALALVKAFRFKNALMEEHFNESYAESYNYPKTTLKGMIEGLSLEKLSEKPMGFPLNAEITFHGTTKSLIIPLEISKKGEVILIYADFNLKPSDFNIEIPGIVRKKVAREVNVVVDLKMAKK